MKNPQPRFAYDEDTDTIFDYVTSQSHPCDAIYYAPDGEWDLAKVKELILAGKSIETAYKGPANKVEQTNADFLKEPDWFGGEAIAPAQEEEPKG